MLRIHEIGTASWLLAIGVSAAALLLGVMLWRDRHARSAELSNDDAEHYARQDARRVAGTLVMLLLAAGVFFGSRIPARVHERANPLFVQVWLGVFLLIFWLLLLGMLDWRATRLYARRHREAMLRARIELIKEGLHLHPFGANGQHGHEGPRGDFPA